jgi:hypothetical protein
MQRRTFGKLGDVSALTLSGGGIGQVWGPTTRAEAIATVRAAWEAGITFAPLPEGEGRTTSPPAVASVQARWAAALA